MTRRTKGDLGAAERDEWTYSPAVGVGPLRFGMSLDEVIKAAETLGRPEVSDCELHHRVFAPTQKIEIRRRGVAHAQPFVTCYVSLAVGLFCLVADALNGPQITHHGIALVGRERAELESEVTAYAEVNDTYFLYSPSGYAAPDDHGIVIVAQRVGQILLSRPLFLVTRDGANTEWDSIPSEEHRYGRDDLDERAAPAAKTSPSSAKSIDAPVTEA